MPLLMIDLDDTLVQRAPLVRAWAQEHLPHDVEAAIAADGGGFGPVDPEGAIPVAELRTAVNDRYRLAPAVRDRLAALRREGWRIAVITNGPVETQARKVEVTGLGALVDAVCISEEVGVRKPDPKIFQVAAERAGTTLSGAWMVGDNLDADIAGGHAVGATTIWVRPQHDWLSFTYAEPPDHAFDEVEAALDHLIALGNR